MTTSCHCRVGCCRRNALPIIIPTETARLTRPASTRTAATIGCLRLEAAMPKLMIAARQPMTMTEYHSGDTTRSSLNLDCKSIVTARHLVNGGAAPWYARPDSRVRLSSLSYSGGGGEVYEGKIGLPGRHGHACPVRMSYSRQ